MIAHSLIACVVVFFPFQTPTRSKILGENYPLAFPMAAALEKYV